MQEFIMFLIPIFLAALVMNGMQSAPYTGPHFDQRSIVSDAHRGD